MARVFVVGATGGTGIRVCQQLAARGHKVYGLHRKPEQAYRLSLYGIQPVLGDLIHCSPEQMATFLSPAETIVFLAHGRDGTPADRNAVNELALTMIARAAITLGGRRLIYASCHLDTSAHDVDHTALADYHSRREAEIVIAGTDLDWVALRSAPLSDEVGAGSIQAGLAVRPSLLTRDDLAEAMRTVIEHPELRQIFIEVSSGDAPIAAALRHMIRYSPKPTGRIGSVITRFPASQGRFLHS
jgi:uncharacterized protein YbjT (DUF2867 family)